jgi:hypothetical protein
MSNWKRKEQKNNSKKQDKTEPIDSFGPEDLFDDCPVCQAEKMAMERGKSLTTTELKNAFQQAKEKGAVVGGSAFEKDDDFNPEEFGLEPIGTAENFEMPKWMECVWRRVPCGKNECKICGKINQDRLEHIIKNEDPDSMESALEDVGNSLGETLGMIKQHAQEMGIDIENIGPEELEEPPEPKDFPLYLRIEKWRKNMENIIDSAEIVGAPWLFTEAVADLLWYKNTISAKTYRQLCNRWHIDRGDEYGEFDYKYTNYVLKECLSILKHSLFELAPPNIPNRDIFARVAKQLGDLEHDILNI